MINKSRFLSCKTKIACNNSKYLQRRADNDKTKTNKKGENMKLEKIGRGILIIASAIIAILMIGLAGQLDHDEYIEANLTPKAQFLK